MNDVTDKKNDRICFVQKKKKKKKKSVVGISEIWTEKKELRKLNTDKTFHWPNISIIKILIRW